MRKPACKIPKKLEWKLNASTGRFIAKIGPNTNLVREGREGHYLYRAEYWGDFGFNDPIGRNALTARKALKDLCSDVRRQHKARRR